MIYNILRENLHIVKERSQGQKFAGTLHPRSSREANQKREKQWLEGQETQRKALTEEKYKFEIS